MDGDLHQGPLIGSNGRKLGGKTVKARGAAGLDTSKPGEKLGAGFASRSRILFIIGLELAPSDPVLFLFDMFVVFRHVQK